MMMRPIWGFRPLVLVVHNYAGMKQFDIDQAAYIARSGFTALAVDMCVPDRGVLVLAGLSLLCLQLVPLTRPGALMRT